MPSTATPTAITPTSLAARIHELVSACFTLPLRMAAPAWQVEGTGTGACAPFRAFPLRTEQGQAPIA